MCIHHLQNYVFSEYLQECIEQINLRAAKGSRNLGSPFWVHVQGAYGSGKSSFLGAMSALWENAELLCHKQAGIPGFLPRRVHESLEELLAYPAHAGGLHVVKGTHLLGARDFRTGVIAMFLEALGLPATVDNVPLLCGLHMNSMIEPLKSALKVQGLDWRDELGLGCASRHVCKVICNHLSSQDVPPSSHQALLDAMCSHDGHGRTISFQGLLPSQQFFPRTLLVLDDLDKALEEDVHRVVGFLSTFDHLSRDLGSAVTVLSSAQLDSSVLADREVASRQVERVLDKANVRIFL